MELTANGPSDVDYPEILAYITAFQILDVLDRSDLTDREKTHALALAYQTLEQRVASVPDAPLPRDPTPS